MQNAISFLSTLKQGSQLNICPIFIGPHVDTFNASLKIIERLPSRKSITLSSKDSDAFFKELKLSQSQKNLFEDSPLTCLINCSQKFLEKTIDYLDIFRSNFILHAPKLSYKSPLISKLEKSRQFIVLTCFNPNPQEILTLASAYSHFSAVQLKPLMPNLPKNLLDLLDELDKIRLVGLEAYAPSPPQNEEDLDSVFYKLLSADVTGLQSVVTLLTSGIEPTFMLKSITYQLGRLKSYISASGQQRMGLKLNKLTQTRFNTLSRFWTTEKLKTIQVQLYHAEHSMRLHHEIAPLLLQRELSELFILSQTKPL